MADLLSQLGIESSSSVKARNIKLLMWGPTGSRKTETVLRYFPDVLMIDAEGNTDMCVDKPEIPEFLRVKTKDVRKVLEIIDMVAAGKIKFPDGRPVRTIGIDTITVLWSVGQETASALAEKRAQRYNKPADEATTTQLDWVVAKRPMKRIYTRLDNSPVPYLVLLAREKDLYIEDPSNKNNLIKQGVTIDAMKGVEYEVNAALHLFKPEGNKWKMEVTKVQGDLSTIFPMGGTLDAFPAKALHDYANRVKPHAEHQRDEDEIASDIALQESIGSLPRTMAGLTSYATQRGIDPAKVGEIMKASGFSSFNSANFDKMVKAIDSAAETAKVMDAEAV